MANKPKSLIKQQPAKQKQQTVFGRAFADTTAAPGWALFCNFFAYGCILAAAGFDVLQSLFGTFIIYALPGQIAMADGYAGGASLITIVTICWLVNLRLLPMSLAIVPLIRQKSRVVNLLAIHFVAITGWLNFYSNYSEVAAKDVFRYYISSNLLLWMFAFAGTVSGFYFKDRLPAEVFFAILMLNPLYFLCTIAEAGIRNAGIGLAVIAGFFLYPLFAEIDPNWAIILAGLTGGTLAYLLKRKIPITRK